MKTALDKILLEYADQACEVARLGRNGVHTPPDLASAELLAGLEANGHGSRFLDSKSRIAWKATPKLRQYLRDLKLDAQGDLEDI
jgi:hypothetical protein